MKRMIFAATAMLLLATPIVAPAQQSEPTAEQRAFVARMETLRQSLHPVSGDVIIPEARATLSLGGAYYFLPADEAKRVLTEGWNNPAGSVNDVLGLVFPTGKTFLDDSWGAVITYQPTGYVADDDAQSADYDAMLKQGQANEEEINKQRQAAGFPTQHLVGWAQPPSYDKASHALVWARDIRFSGQSVDTLNYDVRMLGRSGVLSLNMIATMPQLPQVRAAAERFARTASFQPGSRYADFDPATDTKAEYGVAGLVAAGVGVAAAKKLGILALLLGFGKKFIVLFAVAGVAIANWFRRVIGRKAED